LEQKSIQHGLYVMKCGNLFTCGLTYYKRVRIFNLDWKIFALQPVSVHWASQGTVALWL